MPAIILALLALDWAALHDIMKGEPDLYNEYGMVVFSLVVFGMMLYSGSRRRKSGLP